MTTARRSTDPTSLTSMSARVSKLETSVEVLGNRMTVLSADISDVGRQQENFYQEWRDQKKHEDQKVQSRQITVPAAFGIVFGLISSMAILAGVGSFIIDSKIATSTLPLTSRQDSLADSVRAGREETLKIQNDLSRASSTSAGDRSVLMRHDVNIDAMQTRLRTNNEQVIRNEERLKALERETALWDRIKEDKVNLPR